MTSCIVQREADVHATGYIMEDCLMGPLGQLEHDFVPYHGTQEFLGGDDTFPLFIAAKKQGILVTDVLLLLGHADVTQTNSFGQSALHQASMFYDESFRYVPPSLGDSQPMHLMRKLIDAGANVNLQDASGKTPLHYACEIKNRTLILVLIQKGADITLTDKYGNTPLHTIALCSFEETEELLKICDPSDLDIIEAYEIAALNRCCPNPYNTLYEATKMRIEHNLPKTILPPMECYDMIKEWETLEELDEIKDDLPRLKLQSLLAQERIFSGKHSIGSLYAARKG